MTSQSALAASDMAETLSDHSPCSTHNILNRLFSTYQPSNSLAPLWSDALDRKSQASLKAILGEGGSELRQKNLAHFWQAMAKGDQAINFSSTRQKIISFQEYLRGAGLGALQELKARDGFRQLLRDRHLYFNEELKIFRRGHAHTLKQLEELRSFHRLFDEVVEKLPLDKNQAQLIGGSLESTGADLAMMKLKKDELETYLRDAISKCTK